MPKSSGDYHDYVIKDGKLIARFNDLYTDFEDPWMQSQQPNKYARTAGILHLQKWKIKSVLECGCGLGYYADRIYKETHIIPESIDISPVAVERARNYFPHLNFSCRNVVTDLLHYRHVDCVLLSEIIWFLLPDLKNIFQTLEQHFKGKYLLVNQVFYKGTQQYGTEYFTNLSTFLDYVPFEAIGVCEATTKDDITIETSTMFMI